MKINEGLVRSDRYVGHPVGSCEWDSIPRKVPSNIYGSLLPNIAQEVYSPASSSQDLATLKKAQLGEIDFD